MTHMHFTFHSDPGHGWLFVSHLQLRILGLTEASFTSYSYRDGFGVYAEEDFDAGTALRAHTEKYGCNPTVDTVHHANDAPIRSLPRCTGDFDSIVASVA